VDRDFERQALFRRIHKTFLFLKNEDGVPRPAEMNLYDRGAFDEVVPPSARDLYVNQHDGPGAQIDADGRPIVDPDHDAKSGLLPRGAEGTFGLQGALAPRPPVGGVGGAGGKHAPHYPYKKDVRRGGYNGYGAIPPTTVIDPFSGSQPRAVAPLSAEEKRIQEYKLKKANAWLAAHDTGAAEAGRVGPSSKKAKGVSDKNVAAVKPRQQAPVGTITIRPDAPVLGGWTGWMDKRKTPPKSAAEAVVALTTPPPPPGKGILYASHSSHSMDSHSRHASVGNNSTSINISNASVGDSIDQVFFDRSAGIAVSSDPKIRQLIGGMMDYNNPEHPLFWKKVPLCPDMSYPGLLQRNVVGDGLVVPSPVFVSGMTQFNNKTQQQQQQQQQSKTFFEGVDVDVSHLLLKGVGGRSGGGSGSVSSRGDNADNSGSGSGSGKRRATPKFFPGVDVDLTQRFFGKGVGVSPGKRRTTTVVGTTSSRAEDLLLNPLAHRLHELTGSLSSSLSVEPVVGGVGDAAPFTAHRRPIEPVGGSSPRHNSGGGSRGTKKTKTFLPSSSRNLSGSRSGSSSDALGLMYREGQLGHMVAMDKDAYPGVFVSNQYPRVLAHVGGGGGHHSLVDFNDPIHPGVDTSSFSTIEK
jgi:hypothetical protein